MEFLRSLSLTALPLKRASFSETQLINLDPNEAARNQSEEGLDAMSSEVAWNRRRPTLWQYLTEWWMPRLPSSDCSNCKLTRRWMLWIVKSSVIFFSGFTFALMVMSLGLPGDEPFDDAFHNFQDSFSISPFRPGYPVEFLKRVLPIQCHSHNDYWRQRPLFSALGTGCISVEADVWLVDDHLLVGHAEGELTHERTLQSLYIDPLVEVLEYMNLHTSSDRTKELNGVFYQDPAQTLVLLIDFKTPDIWSHAVEQLGPLRERGYLTTWNGQDRIMRPITVVVSGSTPFHLLTLNDTYRDIFYDAPLGDLDEWDDLEGGPDRPSSVLKYNPSNSYYASANLFQAIGALPGFSFTEPQTELLRVQIGRAREQGLVPRYWGIPRWPRGLRDRIWDVLIHENTGVLNVDDLRAARKGMWYVGH